MREAIGPLDECELVLEQVRDVPFRETEWWTKAEVRYDVLHACGDCVRGGSVSEEDLPPCVKQGFLA